MKNPRTTQERRRRLAAFFVVTAFGWPCIRAAEAAPVKVACIGEHTTHSDLFPPTNRESQPVGMQEYPALLQTLLGAGYDVHNFGDATGSVLQGYTPAPGETHPYVNGSNPNGGPGYQESLAFLPDIVIIGSWGRHDWGMSKAPTEVFTLAGFQQGFDDLVQRYQNLSSHPKIFISLPIPIPFGQGDVPDEGVTTSSVLPTVRAVAVQYHLPLIDLYTPFLGHKELFIQPPQTDSEGEHVNAQGRALIASTVNAALIAALTDDAGTGTDAASDASEASPDAALSVDAAMPIDVAIPIDVGISIDAAMGLGGGGGSGESTSGGQNGGQDTGGNAGGGSTMPSAGSAGLSSPAASPSNSGCSCSVAHGDRSATHLMALVLSGVALGLRRRRSAVRQLPADKDAARSTG
jgi:MYXO-CTERM domain-containing protein